MFSDNFEGSTMAKLVIKLFHFLLLLVIAVTAAMSAKKKDKKKVADWERHPITQPPPVLPQNLNICDLQNHRELNIYCHCDVLEVQNATTANCWLFNNGERPDAPVWDGFRSQTKITKMDFHIRYE